ELEAQLPELDAQDAVGVAGTVHQLADLTGRDHVTAAEAELWLDTLAVLPLEARRELPRMNPDRAPTIVAGALIVGAVLGRYGLPGIGYSVRDILDGAALEAAALPETPEGDAPPGAYTCC